MRELSIGQVQTVLDAQDLNYEVDDDVVRLGFTQPAGLGGFMTVIAVKGPVLILVARCDWEVQSERRADLLEAVNAASSALRSAQVTVMEEGAVLQVQYDVALRLVSVPTQVLASLIASFVETTIGHLQLVSEVFDSADGLDDVLEGILDSTASEEPQSE